MEIDNEITVEIAKKLPIEEIYKDGLQPVIIEVGRGLKNTVKLVLTPISALAWGYDKIAEHLNFAIPEYFKSRNISSDKIFSPDYSIFIPALEAMRYTKDEIRTKFVNLICASMNIDTAEFVHPAFTEILKQLTSDEAKILNKLPGESLFEPVIDIAIEKPQKEGLFTVYPNISIIGEEANCQFPEKVSVYLNNLVRLGLLTIPETSYMADEWRYAKIEQNRIFADRLTSAEKQGEVSIIKKMVGITSLGADFIKVCT